jgi:type VI secretion system protein ImpC
MSTEQKQGSSSPEAAGGSLLDDILAESTLRPSDEGYEVTKAGMQAFIAQMLAPAHKAERIDKSAVDMMIAEIDQKLSAQLNEILHHKEFQKLESAWRGLKYVIDNTDFRENVRVEILNCSKEDLQADFEDAPEVVQSGLYRIAYSNEYGVFGGKPYGLINAFYDFGPGPQDLALLSKCASVAAMAHAPFLSNASPEFFGESAFTSLPQLKDLKSIFEGPQYARWRGFRDSEDSRYVGLAMPRFLLRLPYGAKTVPVKSFNFQEEVVGDHDKYLWGYASCTLATRIADSFAKYRWCPNIIGPQSGGTVDNLPLHQYEAMGEIQTKIPTEALITDRREFELAEEGFIPLVFRKDSNNACFFSANSTQRPKIFAATPEGKSAETNFLLGTQLPYMFIISRLAHYLKVLQREQIGSWKERGELERELNSWIGQFISAQDSPPASVRSSRPLRSAAITVSDVEGQAGWYKVSIQVKPHIKYMGADFTLSLVGKLDKS